MKKGSTPFRNNFLAFTSRLKNLRLVNKLSFKTRGKFLTGFTLIEIMVVLAIIGLLASIVLTSLQAARVNARDGQRISQLKNIQSALELYAANNNNSYPGGDQKTVFAEGDFKTGLETSLSPTYIGEIPLDPLNINDCGNNNDCRQMYVRNITGANNTGFTCGGLNADDNFEYVLFFSLENPNSNFPTANTYSITHSHCLPGPRRS